MQVDFAMKLHLVTKKLQEFLLWMNYSYQKRLSYRFAGFKVFFQAQGATIALPLSQEVEWR
jgi:hypothetical protein